MNLLMVTNSYAPNVGGIEQSIERFTEDFRRQGHRTLVVAPTCEGAAESDENVVRVPAIQNAFATNYALTMPFYSGLHERVSEFRPDLIHSHYPFMLGDTALRLARELSRPLVFTFHSLYERYVGTGEDESKVLAKLLMHLPVEYGNLCDLTIAPTESIARMARERGAESPMVIIPTGVDTATFSNGDPNAFRKRFDIPRDAPLIGHVGRIIPAKNLSYLAEAVAQTLEQRPDAWFAVVGEGEAEAAMKTTVQDHGVGERTVFTGALHGDDLVDAYTAMDLFVFASKTDTQGLVLVEALSAGTPVSALDAPGARDVIQPECGRLVDEDSSPAAYSQCLLDLLQDTAALDAMARAAPPRAEDFDRTVCAEKMLEVYSELIAEFAAASREDARYTVWERLQNRFAAEWDLLREKGNLVAVALAHNDSD